jgi:hypothetical protein
MHRCSARNCSVAKGHFRFCLYGLSDDGIWLPQLAITSCSVIPRWIFFSKTIWRIAGSLLARTCVRCAASILRLLDALIAAMMITQIAIIDMGRFRQPGYQLEALRPILEEREEPCRNPSRTATDLARRLVRRGLCYRARRR